MVLGTEWAEVEEVEVRVQGGAGGVGGFGFNIAGGRSTGVVVKSVAPGAAALQPGDHLVCVGGVSVRGLSAEQAAGVLRRCGAAAGCTRVLVARPYPRHPHHSAHTPCASDSPPPALCPTRDLLDPRLPPPHPPDLLPPPPLPSPLPSPLSSPSPPSDQPELQLLHVQLNKNVYGLGITVAGYVCEKEDLSGIFVKSIIDGSSAEASGTININDRIIEVDGVSLADKSNHEAVELLKKTGITVSLVLERFLRGPKYEHLQLAIFNDGKHSLQDPEPSDNSLMWTREPSLADGSTCIEDDLMNTINADVESSDHGEQNNVGSTEDTLKQDGLQGQTICNGIEELVERAAAEVLLVHNEAAVQAEMAGSEEPFEQNKLKDKLDQVVDNERTESNDGNLDEDREEESRLRASWAAEVDSDEEIIVCVAQRDASAEEREGALGISVEGAARVVGREGREEGARLWVRGVAAAGALAPHLLPGDELLQLGALRLRGLEHRLAVAALRRAGPRLRVVAARHRTSPRPRPLVSLAPTCAGFEARRIISASAEEPPRHARPARLRRASDGEPRAPPPATSCSRPLWSSREELVEVEKGSGGLGFSILDYLAPVAGGRALVVRGVVAGGAAWRAGGVAPGDRVLSVNGLDISTAPLARAVHALKRAPPGLVRLGLARALHAPPTPQAPPAPHAPQVNGN